MFQTIPRHTIYHHPMQSYLTSTCEPHVHDANQTNTLCHSVDLFFLSFFNLCPFLISFFFFCSQLFSHLTIQLHSREFFLCCFTGFVHISNSFFSRFFYSLYFRI